MTSFIRRLWRYFLAHPIRTRSIANALQSSLFRTDMVSCRIGTYDTIVIHVYKMNGDRLRFEYPLSTSFTDIANNIADRSNR